MYMHVLTRFFLSISLYSFLLLYVALHCIILCCTTGVANKLHHKCRCGGIGVGNGRPTGIEEQA